MQVVSDLRGIICHSFLSHTLQDGLLRRGWKRNWKQPKYSAEWLVVLLSNSIWRACFHASSWQIYPTKITNCSELIRHQWALFDHDAFWEICTYVKAALQKCFPHALFAIVQQEPCCRKLSLFNFHVIDRSFFQVHKVYKNSIVEHKIFGAIWNLKYFGPVWILWQEFDDEEIWSKAFNVSGLLRWLQLDEWD